MKLRRMALAVGALAVAGGLVLGGTALASPASVAGDTTTATVTTPDGSFHIPVVPYPFSGSLETTFSLYTLPQAPAGSVYYEVFLSTPGVEDEFNPPLGSTYVLNSDTTGLLFGQLPADGLPDPITDIDFSTSGLVGLVNGAGDYSLGVKFLSDTGVTGVWWTSVYFNGAITPTSTTTPDWQWDPFDTDGTDTSVATTSGTSVSVAPSGSISAR
jgi:hypothetical protein